jgi:Uma2 family endonuclease
MAEVLQTASSTKTKMSWEEFLAAGEEWQRWELVDGQVEFKGPATSARRGLLVMNLCGQLRPYCGPNTGWVALAGDPTFTMVSGNWRCPIVAMIRRGRAPLSSHGDNPVDCPPDIAFEFHSPEDNPAQIARKRKDYQESGVIQVWIDAETRAAEVVYPDRAAQLFDEHRLLVIDGLDGFSLDLKALFEV